MYAPDSVPFSSTSKNRSSDPIIPVSIPDPVPGKEMDELTLKGYVKEGDFVLVSWNNCLFPGLLMSVGENGTTIDCMEKDIKCGKWPEEKDILHYKWCDIDRKISPLKLIKRGSFSITF